MIIFEWDEHKSSENQKKHNASFEDTTLIWQGLHVTVDSIAYTVGGEVRNASIGLIRDKLFTAIWTERNEKIRLISVRRARDGEEKIYWKKISEQL